MLGLLIAAILAYVASVSLWTAILNLRFDCLICRSTPIVPLFFMTTAFVLFLPLPILSGTLLLTSGDLHFNSIVRAHCRFL